MKEVLVKSFGFILIIFLGYVLKKRGIFKKDDGLILAKIVMNITLPASIIAGVSNVEIDMSLVGIILLGFSCNIVLMIVAGIAERKSSRVKQGISMNNYAGYNIGNFGIPFTMSFFEPTALVYMCMFDMGSAIMGLGGTYSFTKMRIEGNNSFNIKSLIKTVLKSIAVDVYLIICTLSILNIRIPDEVVDIASMIGTSNGFLAMFLIGIMLDIHVSKEQVKGVSKILINRYVTNGCIALFVFFILPLPILAKQIITLALFTPLSTISAVYSRMIDKDDPIPAIANSISMIISIAIMLSLIIIFLK